MTLVLTFRRLQVVWSVILSNGSVSILYLHTMLVDHFACIKDL